MHKRWFNAESRRDSSLNACSYTSEDSEIVPVKRLPRFDQSLEPYLETRTSERPNIVFMAVKPASFSVVAYLGRYSIMLHAKASYICHTSSYSCDPFSVIFFLCCCVPWAR
jgi:hypothetical protein